MSKKADRKSSALKKAIISQCVYCNGKLADIAGKDLVPGDVMPLEAGVQAAAAMDVYWDK
ncbi:hypothetical protein U9R62_12000 [Cylindrospermopsis raciborskii DSH]|uniref:hypothetical protein n=1 Tax=Cylindrospermopsis raciborskii TaxID=77022 RepID=UPI002EDAF567